MTRLIVIVLAIVVAAPFVAERASRDNEDENVRHYRGRLPYRGRLR